MKKTAKKPAGLTGEERAALRERIKEQNASKDKAELERSVIAKIDAMKEPDRTIAKRLHDIVKASAPALSPRLWYGMPAYAVDGKVVCFFQDAQKFKTRYATLGFSDKAHLDDGTMWPTSFALEKLADAEEAKIVALLKKATN